SLFIVTLICFFTQLHPTGQRGVPFPTVAATAAPHGRKKRVTHGSSSGKARQLRRASSERRLGSGPSLQFFTDIHGGHLGSFSRRLRNIRLQVHSNAQIARVWTAWAKCSLATARSPSASRKSPMRKCA